MEDSIVMLLLRSSNIVEIESTYDEEEDKEASCAYPNQEVEREDQNKVEYLLCLKQIYFC